MPLDGTDYDPVVGALRLAKDILVSHGWRQWSFGTHGAPHCVIGAIKEAAAIIARDNLRYHQIAWDAGYCYGTAIGVVQVQRWNDSPERKLEEIFDGFERAVARRMEMLAEVA